MPVDFSNAWKTGVRYSMKASRSCQHCPGGRNICPFLASSVVRQFFDGDGERFCTAEVM